MGHERARWPLLVGAVVLWSVATSTQADETFKVRLSSVPIDAVTALTTTGSGSLTAVLAGNRLTLRGRFDGMNSPATVAHVHRAPRGLRGPNVWDLSVTKAQGGIVEGSITLTAGQIADLERGWYYVQIHTEKNPDGQLRGWLLK